MSPQDAPSLFDAAAEDGGGVVDPTRPLADRLRPRALTEVVGQDHLLAPDAPLGRMVASGRLSSIVLWGPPGCGKTTIARLLADRTGLVFEQVSATFSGVTDLRRVFAAAARHRRIGRGTLSHELRDVMDKLVSQASQSNRKITEDDIQLAIAEIDVDDEELSD